MPRDISGNFTLDTSNPVVPGTVIETGWANPTLSDIAAALTDSLSRTGSGGMLAPLKFGDGTKTSPGESWVNEPTSGWYRAASHDFRFAILGVDVLQTTVAGLTVPLAVNTGTFTASTKVVTPLVKGGVGSGLIVGVNNDTGDWEFTTTGIFRPVLLADNAGDLGDSTHRWRTGYFGTSVVTPIIDTGADAIMLFRINGVTKWAINPSGGGFSFVPGGDLAFAIGDPAARISKVFTPIIDSGSIGPLRLMTGNGLEQFRVAHIPGAANFFSVNGNIPGADPQMVSVGASPDINMLLSTKGNGSVLFYTNTFTENQFQISRMVACDRHIFVTGGLGATDASFNVTAGSIAFSAPVKFLAGSSGSITTASNVLAANVALGNTGLYFDGPSVNVGATGTWFVSGYVTCQDTSNAGAFMAKLWDGTTVIASAEVSFATGFAETIHLSGFSTNPAGNLKISVRDTATAFGLILANGTGNGKDSAINAMRI